MKYPIIFLIFITILGYFNIFSNQLTVDDHIFVDVYHPTVVEAFTGSVPPGHEGVYRPIRGVLYKIYHYVWGANLTGYHLHSLLVHLASSILVYFIVKRVTASPLLPFIVGILFALHPIHTEAITYIAASMDTTGLVFFLGAFLLYLRGKTIPSLVLATLAYFTTEMALTLPLFIIFYDWTFNQLSRKRLSMYALYTFPAFVYVAIRFFVLDISTRGPYLAGTFYLTMLTMSKVLVEYLKVLIWPINLVSNHIISPGIEAFVYRNYQTSAIAAQSIFDLPILLSLTILFILIYLIFKLRSHYPLISFSLGIFFIGLLPVMELVPQGSMMNERSLYLSSIGFVIILALGINELWNWRKNIGIIVLVAISIFYLVKTNLRNNDWKNDTTLWQADIRQNPTQNAYARFALGNSYNDQKNFGQALREYQESVKINPGFAVGWASLGRTSVDLGNIQNAILYYEQALKIDPNFWEVKNNLDNIYKQI